MPEVLLNGERTSLPEGATAADAVRASGAPASARGVAVALDGEVVPRAEWHTTALCDGGRVEILNAVQGG
jgi:sulfur carrier protein